MLATKKLLICPVILLNYESNLPPEPKTELLVVSILVLKEFLASFLVIFIKEFGNY